MSRALFSIALLSLAVSGCNTGDVQVTGGQNALPAPSGGVSGNSRGAAGSLSVNSPQSEAKVYFERVLSSDSNGDLESILGISHASVDTTINSSSGVVTSDSNIGTAPIYASSQNQVVYLKTDGFMRSSLMTATSSSGATQTLFSFSDSVASFALAPSKSAVAWINSSGAAFVSTLPSGTTQSLDLSGDDATGIEWSGETLLLKTAQETRIYSTKDFSLQRKIEGVVASALSPDGTQLAYVNSKGALIVSGKQDTTIATIESSEIYDFAWATQTQVSYWTRLSSGVEEVRSVDLKARAKETTLATLNVPATVTDGVVCPTFDGSTLYLADFSNGQYLIEKMQGNSVQTFASAEASDESFICPKVENSGSATR